MRKRRDADAKYRAANKEARNSAAKTYMTERRQRRADLLSQFPCFLCKETDSDLIDWHHVDPEDKDFLISKAGTAEDLWWNEVLKCIPVCALCHRKIHTNKLCLIPLNLP